MIRVMITGLAVVIMAVPVAVVVMITMATTVPLMIVSSSTVPGSPAGPTFPPRSAVDVGRVLAWAETQVGDRYRMGANGPDVWDCSSFTRAAWAQAGVNLPRLAQDQRDWLAAGHGTSISYGTEQPGDLVFWDSYLGPATIGHVAIVQNPHGHQTVEAHNTRFGVGHFTYHPNHHRFEIWRPTTKPVVQPSSEPRAQAAWEPVGRAGSLVGVR